MEYVDGFPALEDDDPIALTPEYTRELRAHLYMHGWIPITPAPGYAGQFRYRRVGPLVEVRWSCSTSIPANAFVTPLFTLPAQARPSTLVAVAAYGSLGYPMTSVIDTFGVVFLRNNHTAAVGNNQGQVMFSTD